MRRVAAVLFSFAILAAGARAGADVPPDPGSIEAHCTPAEQCPSGIVCDRRVNPRPEQREATEACVQKAQGKGFSHRCGAGATVGMDLYCPPGEKGTWQPAGAPSASGSRSSGMCALALPGASGAEATPSWVLLALALAFAARRRT